jgi:hypothetical protein
MAFFGNTVRYGGKIDRDIHILKKEIKNNFEQTDDEINYMIEIYKEIYPSVWFEHQKETDDSFEYYEVNNEKTGKIKQSCILEILRHILTEKWRYSGRNDLICRVLKRAADESYEAKISSQINRHRETLTNLNIRPPSQNTVCEIECENHKEKIIELFRERQHLYNTIDSLKPEIYTH